MMIIIRCLLRYHQHHCDPFQLSKFSQNFPTLPGSFQLKQKLSNVSIFQLFVFSNCPFQLHVSRDNTIVVNVFRELNFVAQTDFASTEQTSMTFPTRWFFTAVKYDQAVQSTLKTLINIKTSFYGDIWAFVEICIVFDHLRAFLLLSY